MEYKYYTAADFSKDQFFQQWVLSPDAETESFWIEYMQSNPHQLKAIQDARDFIDLLQFTEEDIFESRISNLKNKIDQAIDDPLTSFDHQPFKDDFESSQEKTYKYAWLAVAASVSILLAMSWLFLENRKSSATQTIAAIKQKQETPRGKRTFMTLEDGTKVWLNADSKLEFPQTFKSQPFREVYLEGEAFFDVAENKHKPFIVHASEINIKVLGTAFNVKSYSKDKNVETTLVRGKVSIESVADKTKHVTLAPSQQAIFEKVSNKIVLDNQVDVEPYTSWKEGRLVFDDQPLSMIIEELERWYNVTIHVEDKSSLNCRFSAKVNNKTLREVLDLFKDSDGINYRMEGSNVFIKGTLCD